MPNAGSQPPTRFRGWKRTAILALLLLAGGAVMNVAVAWGCRANVLGESRLTVRATTVKEARWLEAQNEVPTNLVYQTNHLGYRLLEIDLADSIWDESDNAMTHTRRPFVVYMQSAGLPMLSLSGEIWFHSRDWAIMHGQSPSINKPPDELSFVWPIGEKYLPLRPILPGFIINTLFYAVLLWLLFFAPFATRRMLRRRRGLCEKCAYPIGVSAVCTECGAAVSRSRKAEA